MDALAFANEIRLRQAHLRKELKALGYRPALREVADLIDSDDPDEPVARLRVVRLLGFVPRLGPATSARVLAAAFGAVPPSQGRRVGELTRRQRSVLAGVLRRVADGEDAAGEREAA